VSFGSFGLTAAKDLPTCPRVRHETTYTCAAGKRAKKTPAVDGDGFVIVDAASNRVFSEKSYLRPISSTLKLI
jgi:hypothetical protein